MRQGGVLVAAIVCVAGALVGGGTLGGEPVSEAAGGALSADATLLAPAGPAFSIWSVIYVALLVFTVWHTLPRNATSSLARAVGWWATLSMLLNAMWLATVQAEQLWLSVVVIVALVLVLGQLLVLGQGLDDGAGPWVVAVTFGLYLGWSSVATCANVAAVLVDSGVDPGRTTGEVVAVLVLAAVCVIVRLVSRRVGDARWAVAVAVAWGLGWIAWGRLGAEPESLVVGVAAIVAAVLGLALAATARPLRR